MSDAVLRTINLTKRYKSRVAVDHLNIDVRRGDIFGFLGPNGAGKSTTIRMILHLAFPTEGDVELFGVSLNRARHKALAKVGAVVEKPAFCGHLSALNFAVMIRVRGMRRLDQMSGEGDITIAYAACRVSFHRLHFAFNRSPFLSAALR